MWPFFGASNNKTSNLSLLNSLKSLQNFNIPIQYLNAVFSSPIHHLNAIFSTQLHLLNTIFNPEEHIIIPIELRFQKLTIKLYAMIDSGGTSSFIDADFVRKHKIPLIEKPIPWILEAVDGRPVSSGNVTHETTPLRMDIGYHREIISLNITHLGHYPVILGISWLKRHDPNIVWSKHRITFSSEYCDTNCLTSPRSIIALPTHPENTSCSQPTPEENIATSSTKQFQHPIINIVSATAFARTIKKCNIYLLRLSEIVKEINVPSDFKSIPQDYHEFADVFSKEKADKLPDHSLYDHTIPLENGASPPFGPIYRLSEVELQALRDYLEENLGKGFITASSSPAGAPILFSKKKDGSLRLCVDYRGLNKITIKNRYPLPLISEMLDRVSKATYFSKIDLRGAYNLVRIKSGEEWKTAFRCRYGHFEYRVMPFGLTNAPATFQHFMNDTFRDYLDRFCVIYLDDILIYSNSLAENKTHVKLVLARLRSARLFAKPEKCQFHMTEIEFLGFLISARGISMDPGKVSAITSWPPPRSVHDIQVFIGFANFYRRFISNYSKITSPITSLLKKNINFIWSEAAQKAFDYLKLRFTSAPILRHFDANRPSIIETDASDFAIACIISQLDDKNILHPVAFYSRKLTPAEINYEIYDKEMLAIVTAFKEWRPYLEGSQHKITILTDHRNLEWFTETKKYTRRQARWAELLAGYDFIITYRPGRKGGKPDALSRRGDYQSVNVVGDTPHETDTFLKPHQFLFATSTVSILSINSELQNRIRAALNDDEFLAEHLQYIQNPALDRPPEVDRTLKNYRMADGLVLFRNLIYIPNNSIKLSIMQSHHDSPTSGHFGQAKTFELISREFYWPQMRKFINQYIQSCDVCCRNKLPRHKPVGPLQPLPVPETPWSSVSMDFIMDLPQSSNFNAILVVVDRFSKMSHFLPTTTKVTAEETADIYFQQVFRLHGFPNDIVSDRGTQFTSKFWSRLMELCAIKQNMSTAYHPQTDGQTERVNQILEQYLRIFCNYQQDNWQSLLTLAEFTYNNTKHASTTISPFFANYGYHPRFQLRVTNENKSPSAESYVETLRKVHIAMQEDLKLAQENYKKYYDRRVQKQPNYEIGQRVWLLRKNVSTTRPSSKLDFKRLGPYKILNIIGQAKLAVKLDLPPTMKIHPVFHVSLLEPYHENTIQGRQQAPPPSVTIQGQEEWVVKEVLDSRLRRNRLEYLVEWDGWTPADRTWEPASNSEKLPVAGRGISR